MSPPAYVFGPTFTEMRDPKLVDGKIRDRITVSADASEDTCREVALASDRVQSSVDGKAIARVIVRAPKLVNIVLAG